MINDELKIYRGENFSVNSKIKIHQPTLGQICDLGEQKYHSFIHSFTSTPTDLKYQLHLMGIDWNTLSDYELFLLIYQALDREASAMVFGDLDLPRMEKKLQNNGEIVLYDKNTDAVIDRSVYELAVTYIRKSHNLERHVEKAMNETTKTVLLEEAKEQLERSEAAEYHSFLLPLISTMINMEGFKYNWSTVWDMKINAFMDAVGKLLHIKNVDLLLSSGYSGFGIDLKKISKKDLNYFSRPDEE